MMIPSGTEMTTRVAIVIATRYGQTAKVADRIRTVLQGLGHVACVVRLETELDFPAVPLDSFDGVIIGSPLYNNQYAWQVRDWTKLYKRTLNIMKTAFFSVSFNAADKRPWSRVIDYRLIREFCEYTGLDPDLTATISGAVNYVDYGWVDRVRILREQKRAGGPTDASQTHELTDWVDVELFAKAFGKILEAPLTATKILASVEYLQ